MHSTNSCMIYNMLNIGIGCVHIMHKKEQLVANGDDGLMHAQGQGLTQDHFM